MSTRTTTATTGTQRYNNRSTHGWNQNPGSEDITTLRGYEEEVDPSIDASYARRQTNLRSRFMNPLGQYRTPAMQEATQRSEEGELEQEYGQARRQAWNDKQERTGARRGFLAGLTAPVLTQDSTEGEGANTGQTTQSQPMLPGILQGAATVGAAAL